MDGFNPFKGKAKCDREPSPVTFSSTTFWGMLIIVTIINYPGRSLSLFLKITQLLVKTSVGWSYADISISFKSSNADFGPLNHLRTLKRYHGINTNHTIINTTPVKLKLTGVIGY